jgi:hypothetical protein
VSIPSSITWYSLPNSEGRTYVLLSDITTQLSKQYLQPSSNQFTAKVTGSSGAQFANWVTSYVFAGGWDPVNTNTRHVFDVSWQELVDSAVQYVTPSLSAGQQPGDTLTVQIAELLYQQFGNTRTFVALKRQS